MAFAIVPPDLPKDPYPYVWVTETGAVHELDSEDRTYLETRFHPCDGGRPYVKTSYTTKDGWDSLKGFCPRSQIPKGIQVVAEPVARGPAKPLEEMVQELAEKAGLSLVKNPDGSLTVTGKPNTKKWWQYWR